MLRYKGGMSFTNIRVRGARKRLMFKARTLRKNPSWGQKVSRRKGKVLHGSRIRHVSDGSVESNMDPELGQRSGYENVINKTHNGNVL
jgi:hypothetical protein